jgi:hypothetical protein
MSSDSEKIAESCEAAWMLVAKEECILVDADVNAFANFASCDNVDTREEGLVFQRQRSRITARIYHTRNEWKVSRLFVIDSHRDFYEHRMVGQFPIEEIFIYLRRNSQESVL